MFLIGCLFLVPISLPAKINQLGKIRVGIVGYLNTRPLIFGLKIPPVSSLIEIIEDNPARLAEMLKKSEIDLGLIPVASIPELPEHYLVGDHCIAAEGEAATVCLFSEVPLHEIRTVFLDYQSRTSVELLKWVMREYWDIHPVWLILLMRTTGKRSKEQQRVW
jgi:chorismate dehydratase